MGALLNLCCAFLLLFPSGIVIKGNAIMCHRENMDASKHRILKSISLSVCSSLSLSVSVSLSPLLFSFLEMKSFYVVLAGLKLAV